MIAFNVSVNGVFRCLISLEGEHVMTCILKSAKLDPNGERYRPTGSSLDLSFGGFMVRGEKNIHWQGIDLNLTDTVTIKIVEVDSIDECTPSCCAPL